MGLLKGSGQIMWIPKLFMAALIVRHSYAAGGFTITGNGVVLGDASSGTLIANDQCVTDGVGNFGASESATITTVNAGTLYPKEWDFAGASTTTFDFLQVAGAKYGKDAPMTQTLATAGETIQRAVSRTASHPRMA